MWHFMLIEHTRVAYNSVVRCNNGNSNNVVDFIYDNKNRIFHLQPYHNGEDVVNSIMVSTMQNISQAYLPTIFLRDEFCLISHISGNGQQK